MTSYQISDLEKITGIKAHTIRIWERRYNLIEPYRTSTNIRYYDDHQVKKLLKVSTLLTQGLKISKIAVLSEREMNTHIHELEKISPEDSICTGFINDLIASMLSFDEIVFEKAFASAVVRFGMYEAMMKVFYPFLKKTGLMWSSNDAMPVQEHFASAIIRRKLIVAIDGLPSPKRKNKTFLLFLPPEEWHETGLLLSDYVIRSKGYKTIYLSQNVPLHNLQDVVDTIEPTHLLTIYTARKAPEELNEKIQAIATHNKMVQFLIGGNNLLLESVKKTKNIFTLSSPKDLLDFLKH